MRTDREEEMNNKMVNGLNGGGGVVPVDPGWGSTLIYQNI